MNQSTIKVVHTCPHLEVKNSERTKDVTAFTKSTSLDTNGNEALDTIQAICERAGCAIAFTRQVPYTVRLLEDCLSDANANLKVKAANVLAKVATSVGPEIAKMSKLLRPSLISGVADNKKAMQAAALHALHQWVRHSGKTSTLCVESLLVPL
ncbi:hypothetical protein PsorP6_014693 [Peronosclerospora sorghi]|uniref:Uncharacterized protein n=1 Tax=Peronosclerospora sorghi TaxID=230839 RepID=A0ACC0VTD9_9STRA|nr:hypothetical protein PsorP6_014693 [Peronosclerospora sorghi]